MSIDYSKEKDYLHKQCKSSDKIRINIESNSDLDLFQFGFVNDNIRIIENLTQLNNFIDIIKKEPDNNKLIYPKKIHLNLVEIIREYETNDYLIFRSPIDELSRALFEYIFDKEKAMSSHQNYIITAHINKKSEESSLLMTTFNDPEVWDKYCRGVSGWWIRVNYTSNPIINMTKSYGDDHYIFQYNMKRPYRLMSLKIDNRHYLYRNKIDRLD